jgi:hypothetical protein
LRFTVSHSFDGVFDLWSIGASVRQLFDLPRVWSWMPCIAVRYRELQRQFHPDRFAAEPADVQRVAVQRAATSMPALSVLKDTVLRADICWSWRVILCSLSPPRFPIP